MGTTLRSGNAVSEGQAIERALFWGRCTGGLIIVALGPLVAPGVPELIHRALGLYFIGYAFLMLRIAAGATTPRARSQAGWLAHAFDTVGFLAALVVNATDSEWLTVSAAPLYVIVAVSRMGALGGISAAVALAATHLALAAWRATALGFPFDAASTTVHLAIYGLAALLTIAIDSEMRSLRGARDQQVLSELERTHRLESLGALTGGIAHDFNNLLAVILNNAHLALGTGGEGARKEIEEIRDAAQHGVNLTRQMLVFARGARSNAKVRIDVRRELQYAHRLLRRTIGAGVTLDAHVAEGVPDIELEPGQLERIVMNLVVNARDAMPGGGRISLTASEVRLDGQEIPDLPAGRYLRLVVSDEGVGMPPDVARRVFEPFFTTKQKGHGTGLGLATVHGVTHRAGGHVGLVSEPGRGTSVTVHLPAMTVAATAHPDAPIASVNARGDRERVLLVDDDDAVRRTAARILRDAGYATAEAARPSEAMGRASDGIDLLVTDVVLPEMTGPELAGRIRESMPRLPVLFISGSSYQEGGSLLPKPFTPDQLLLRVREALNTTPVEVS
jgi:signal transduction histidine kinase